MGLFSTLNEDFCSYATKMIVSQVNNIPIN